MNKIERIKRLKWFAKQYGAKFKFNAEWVFIKLPEKAAWIIYEEFENELVNLYGYIPAQHDENEAETFTYDINTKTFTIKL